MDDLLAEQIEYYRARANEYDDWFFRRGRFDRGDEATARWFDEVRLVEAALEGFAPSGRVLELACGTGLWTQRLARYADELTAVDSSPEVLEIAAQRAGSDAVTFVEDDIFTFEPTGRYDVVFFSFFGRMYAYDEEGVLEQHPDLEDNAVVHGVLRREHEDGTEPPGRASAGAEAGRRCGGTAAESQAHARHSSAER